MLEMIIVLLIGTIVYSIIQGVRRGNVSLEERKKHSTLIESVSEIAERASKLTSDASRAAERYKNETKFNLEYCSWFRNFERNVANALEISEQKLKLHESLNANSDIKRIFNEIGASEDSFEGLANQIEPEWVSVGIPPMPASVSDADQNLMRKAIYEDNLDKHKKFIEEIQNKLNVNITLRKLFNEEMIQCGLGRLTQDYFCSLHLSNTFVTSTPPVVKFPNTLSIFNSTRPEAIAALKTLNVVAGAANLQATKTREYREAKDQLDSRAEVRSCAEELKIPHLVHFTRCENLPSILRHGLLSIEDCSASGILAIQNDEMRLDGRPDGTSLSIAFPNYRMFYKYRQLGGEADWAVLILSARILWRKECGFFKHNAADARMRRRSREQVGTAQALREMFDTLDTLRQKWLRSYDPTDPQAEVMVYDPIEPTLIEAIAFETDVSAKKWTYVTGGIETIYAGPGRELFASRAQVRQN